MSTPNHPFIPNGRTDVCDYKDPMTDAYCALPAAVHPPQSYDQLVADLDQCRRERDAAQASFEDIFQENAELHVVDEQLAGERDEAIRERDRYKAVAEIAAEIGGMLGGYAWSRTQQGKRMLDAIERLRAALRDPDPGSEGEGK